MYKKEAIHEREEFKEELYKKIFAITGTPKKILDLGCGLHPLTFPYTNSEYKAVDNDRAAIKKVKKYFKKNKIKGKAELKDITLMDNDDFKEEYDLVFLLKVLDKIGIKKSKELFSKLRARYMVISFATRTIAGKRMNTPKRKWFERIMKHNIVKTIRYFNEICYVIKKEE